jgi:stage V sporulation protein AC
MSSASMEFKSEGLIFGTSVKLFSVVGPVIVNGIVWSTVAGLLKALWGVFF